MIHVLHGMGIHIPMPGWYQMSLYAVAVVVLGGFLAWFYSGTVYFQDEQPPAEPVVQQFEPDPVETKPEPEPEPPSPPMLDSNWLAEQELSAWRGLAAEWGRPEDGGLVQAACRGTPRSARACGPCRMK